MALKISPEINQILFNAASFIRKNKI
jgi:hypothetical protein